MPYFVSRQMYWPDGTLVVEIACGGLHYANPNMLVPKWRSLGEGKEFEDPREAVMAATRVLRAWHELGENDATIAYGDTGGFTMPFESSTIEAAEEWADRLYEKLPKCAECMELLGKETYRHDFSDDDKFCSERCAEKSYYACSPSDEDENQ